VSASSRRTKRRDTSRLHLRCWRTWRPS
jgi:hypothetical protein